MTYSCNVQAVPSAAWEPDHVEAPVEVDVEGRLVKPWVTCPLSSEPKSGELGYRSRTLRPLFD